jgi:hypothetical protein
MKNLSLIILMFCTTVIFAQNYTINGRQADSLFIGLNNPLQLLDFNRGDNVSVIFPSSINGKKRGPFTYSMIVSQPRTDLPIIILKDEIPIDTLIVSIYGMKLKEFIGTRKNGLLKSGTYPLEMIQDIDKIIFTLNIPNYKVKVKDYIIEIWNPNDILYYGQFNDGHFNHPPIQNALRQLKRGGGVSIKKIGARFPWDCGNRPKPYTFIVNN